MSKIRILAVLALASVATAGFTAANPASATSRPHRHHLGTQAVGSDPEFSPLQGLASTIDDLGTSTYPAVYAGVDLSAGELDVYVVAGDDQAFLDAVAATDIAGIPYTVKYSTRSYATQAATSQWLADNQELLQSEGVNPGWWGEYSQADAIRIALQAPTGDQLSELQAAANRLLSPPPTVTAATYLTIAAAVMNTQVPSPGLIAVYPNLLGTGEPATGYNDTKPFFGADQIKYTLNNTAVCTSNFSFNGMNNPGNHWAFTAGHCSNDQTGHDWYTCASTSSGNCNYNVGTVSTVYSNKEDFESIGTSNSGYVWNDTTGASLSVNGYIDAEPGDYVTVDGQTNGAHSDNLVQSGGSTTCVHYGSYFTCHAIVISTGSNNYCPPGDSGGPVFVRESDGHHIKAAGMILGYDNTQTGDVCYAQQVFWIRSEAKVDLIWGN